jgi:hypothetical protein
MAHQQATSAVVTLRLARVVPSDNQVVNPFARGKMEPKGTPFPQGPAGHRLKPGKEHFRFTPGRSKPGPGRVEAGTESQPAGAEEKENDEKRREKLNEAEGPPGRSVQGTSPKRKPPAAAAIRP